MVLILVIMLFLGLVFGSFGSVILTRWGESTTVKQASSIIRGRSQCPHCHHNLDARDLVPILSFIWMGGKCRYCKKKISRFYPILELISALIFVLCAYLFADQSWGLMLFWAMTGWSLWLLIVYDVLRYEVHIPLLLFASGILLAALLWGLFPLTILRGALLFFLFFLLMYLLAKRWVGYAYGVNQEGLGMGDVIIAPYLGALLFLGLGNHQEFLAYVLAFLFFLMLSGAIGILWHLVQNKYFGKKATFLSKKMADQSLPFLPAMIFSVMIIITAQQYLFSWFGF